MKLQLALDELDLPEALELAHRVEKYIDIFEIGTPFIIRCGVRAIREFRKAFPKKEILADTKIMDGGFFETALALDAGANYVTALGATDNATVRGCLKAAAAYQGHVVVDMVCVDDLKARIRELEDLGEIILAVHTGVDQQASGRTPLHDLNVMKMSARKSRISVAGGISSTSIQSYAALQPDIIVVGGAICHADDPAREAHGIRSAMGAENIA